MSTMAERMRAAADAIDDLQRLRHGTHVGCKKCAEKHAASEQLRADADELEVVEKEMREHGRLYNRVATGWADRIRGEMK